MLPLPYIHVTAIVLVLIICCALVAATIVPVAQKTFTPREDRFVISKFGTTTTDDRTLNQICLHIQRLFHLRQLFAVDVIVTTHKTTDPKYVLYTSVLALEENNPVTITDGNSTVTLNCGDLALFYSAHTKYDIQGGRCYIISWRLTEKRQRIPILQQQKKPKKWRILKPQKKYTFRPLSVEPRKS